MEVATIKNERELWVKEAYDKMGSNFLYELTEEEQVIFLWNANVWLNTLLKRKSRSF
jgi:hypothetical protein